MIKANHLTPWKSRLISFMGVCFLFLLLSPLGFLRLAQFRVGVAIHQFSRSDVSNLPPAIIGTIDTLFSFAMLLGAPSSNPRISPNPPILRNDGALMGGGSPEVGIPRPERCQIGSRSDSGGFQQGAIKYRVMAPAI